VKTSNKNEIYPVTNSRVTISGQVKGKIIRRFPKEVYIRSEDEALTVEIQFNSY
jgi:hypothetical protein